jgi:hypothetical protein
MEGWDWDNNGKAERIGVWKHTVSNWYYFNPLKPKFI